MVKSAARVQEVRNSSCKRNSAKGDSDPGGDSILVHSTIVVLYLIKSTVSLNEDHFLSTIPFKLRLQTLQNTTHIYQRFCPL